MSQAVQPFVVRGEMCRMFDWLDGTVPPKDVPDECMVEGPAGTGKTTVLAHWIKAFAGLYPKSKTLVLRETRVSLNNSFLPIWEEVWGERHPVIANGPRKEHRSEYRHPLLGGTVALGGYDNEEKLFSSNWNAIVFIELQETEEEKWMKLHRGLRATGSPFRILIGDTNPVNPGFWANRRAQSGVLDRIVTRFHDNPRLFDTDAQEWTEFGLEYLGKLSRNFHGHVLNRLYYGRWSAAEGAVWADWDPAVHMISGKTYKEQGAVYLRVPGWDTVEDGEKVEKRIRLHKFIGSQDIGYENPGVAQVWGLDSDGRMYMVAEVYKTHWTHAKWADAWVQLLEEFPVSMIVTDWDPAFIRNLNHKLRRAPGGRPVVTEWSKQRGPKGEKAGIDEVRHRMQLRPDGTRGLYLLRDCYRFGPDEERVRDKLPWQTHMEIESYVYPKKEPGKVLPQEGETPDPRCEDHGCDSMRVLARGTWSVTG